MAKKAELQTQTAERPTNGGNTIFIRRTPEQNYFPANLNLSPKQAKFVLTLAKDPEGNQTRAAKEAGYAEHTATWQASQNLRKPHIVKALDYATKRQAAVMVTPERIIEEWCQIAFANPQDFFDDDGNVLPVHKLPPHVAGAIDRLKADGTADLFKLSNKTQALESLTKVWGLYKKDNEQKKAEPDQTVVFVDGDMQGLFDKITKRDQGVIDVTPDTQPHEDDGTSDGT